MHMRSEGRAGRWRSLSAAAVSALYQKSPARSRRGFFVAVSQTTLAEIVPGFPVNEPPPQIQDRTRNGSWEPGDVNQIVRGVPRGYHAPSQPDPIHPDSPPIRG